MSGLLAELGRRLAERWFTLLVLPGMVYLLVAAAGFALGQGEWHDWARLSDVFDSLTTGERQHQESLVVRTLLVLLTAVPVSAALGMLAQALAGPAERWRCGQWPRPFSRPAQRLTERRARRWNDANEKYRLSGEAADAFRRNEIAVIVPERATRLGDRLLAPAERLRVEYGIDLAIVWPRLWLLLPASTREILTEARSRLDAAFALDGWAVLYLLLAVRWWPALLVAVTAAVVAGRRAAPAAQAYADLVESAVDLHLPRLMARLDQPGLTPQRGRALTERLRRGL
jgi:hypothetical protein